MATMRPMVQDVATRLTALFPKRSPQAQQVALQLYRLLAEGHPVSCKRLAARLALPATTLDEIVRQLESRLRYDADGCIVAFGGLSLPPTAHRLMVNGQTLYTWCAWDSLFLPAILQQSAQVVSTCPMTGESIRLVVTPQGVTQCHPPGAVVSFVIPDAVACHEDIVANFCCHVLFFGSVEAGASWGATHTGVFFLSVAEAYALGQQRNAAQFDAL